MVDSVFSTGSLKIFCTGYGVCFKGAALVIGSLFPNLALVMGLPSGLSHAHVCQVPYRSYPPPSTEAQREEMGSLIFYILIFDFIKEGCPPSMKQGQSHCHCCIGYSVQTF